MDQSSPTLLEALMRHEFGQRLRAAFKSKGLRQNSVAIALNVKPQSVNQWLSGKSSPNKDNLLALAKLLGTTSDWLLYGKEDDSIGYEASLTPVDNDLGREVPLLSLEDLPLPDTGFEKNRTANRPRIRTHFPCGPNAAGFVMRDRSMEPRVNPGDIVVVDPDMPLEPGDLVAVRIKSTGLVVFRQFGFAPGDKRVLSPINSHHRSFEYTEKEWDSEITILGVMTERTEHGKKPSS